MGTPAKVVLSVDARQANAEIDRLYARLSNAPGIGIGGGIGGIAAGTALGQMGLGAGRWLLNETGMGAAVSGLKDAAFLQVAGEDAVGKVASALASRESVASRYGLLKSLDMVDEKFLRTAYDLDQKYGAGAQAKGESEIRKMFGIDVTKAFGEAAESVGERIIGAIWGVGTALGNKIGDALGLAKVR